MEEKKGTKFQSAEEEACHCIHRRRRKKTNLFGRKEKNETKEEEACGEVVGCTGEEENHGRKRFFKTEEEENVFFLKYINFYFLNEGYFRKFIQLLGAPAINSLIIRVIKIIIEVQNF